jgi:hypothetical protein
MARRTYPRKKDEAKRVPISLSLSDGLRELANEYLSRQGIEPSKENLKQFTRDWFYQNFGDWLKRQIETDEQAIIV